MPNVPGEPELNRRLAAPQQQSDRATSATVLPTTIEGTDRRDIAGLAARQSVVASAETTPDDYLLVDDRGWTPCPQRGDPVQNR